MIVRRRWQCLFALVCVLMLAWGSGGRALSTPSGNPRSYNADVHYDLTYVLALKAGFTPADAEKVAKCDQGVDDDQSTVATASGTLSKTSSNFRYHFVERATLSDLWHKKIKTTSNLCNLGVFLHALQDNFSHRDHLADGHHGLSYDPDYTHKDSAKARRMAYNTYRSLLFYRWYQNNRRLQLGGKVITDVKGLESYIFAQYPKVEQELDLLRWLAAERTDKPWVLVPVYYPRYVNAAHKTVGVGIPASKGVESLKAEGAKLEIFQ